jgi:hypothetical protein
LWFAGREEPEQAQPAYEQSGKDALPLDLVDKKVGDGDNSVSHPIDGVLFFSDEHRKQFVIWIPRKLMMPTFFILTRFKQHK